MKDLMDGAKVDIDFMKSHTLQPQWYKVLKVFILLGFLVGYGLLFGWPATAIFFAVFVLLSLVVHFTYRAKTKKWTKSWLDFVVVEEGGQGKQERIGKYYYPMVAFNAILSLIISQLLT